MQLVWRTAFFLASFGGPVLPFLQDRPVELTAGPAETGGQLLFCAANSSWAGKQHSTERVGATEPRTRSVAFAIRRLVLWATGWGTIFAWFSGTWLRPG